MIAIIKFLLGGGISAIGKQINEAIRIRETAKTNQAKLQADENIASLKTARDVEVKRLESRANEVPNTYTNIIRIFLSSLVFLILLKMTADYISTGNIHDVPDQLWWFVGLVVTWCFWGTSWKKK